MTGHESEITTEEQIIPDAHRGTMVKSVALLMVAQALDKGLYLVREMLVSARFGLSGLTDAFNIGLYVSNFILALLRPLVEDTFIPVYVEKLARDRSVHPGDRDTADPAVHRRARALRERARATGSGLRRPGLYG